MQRTPRRLLLMLAALSVFILPVAVFAAGGFTDVDDDSNFKADIDWLADAGVTKGCNPPDNTEFCPKNNVTREQMAAFMHRLAANRVVDAKTAVTADSATTAGDADTVDGQHASEFLQLDSVLQPGETITGTFGVAGTSNFAFQAIDFRPNIDPAAVVTGEYVAEADPFTPNCPGHNQALAGYLCFYEVFDGGTTFIRFLDPYGSGAGIRDIGTVAYWDVSSASAHVRGNWALTAPAVIGGASSASSSGPPVP